jgi:hypothetical protein
MLHTGLPAPSGASANSSDRRRYAFGHIICADADALQARPPSSVAVSSYAIISTFITPTIRKIISSHGRTLMRKATKRPSFSFLCLW